MQRTSPELVVRIIHSIFLCQFMS